MASRGESWSREEVEAIVASYFEMLDAGLRGERFNKTTYRRALLPLLAGRTGGAVERKHQNISAVLIEEGVPYISGYKPLGNYQGLLRDVVLDQLGVRITTRALIEAEVERVPAVPAADDILAAWVPAPSPRPGMNRSRPGGQLKRVRAPVDYLLLEARNRALGRAGEEFVLNFERQRLIAARQERLAAQISHVAVTEGDGAGYDILSFAEDGRERLIEVKTTKFGEYTPFYVSRNEVNVSIQSAPSYQLYRLYEFGSATRLFAKAGSIENSFTLEPSTYLARVG
jgi:Domain of unknown function (DUF3883)